MATNLTLSLFLLVSLTIISDRVSTGWLIDSYFEDQYPRALACSYSCLRNDFLCRTPVETDPPEIQMNMCKGVLYQCARDCRRIHIDNLYAEKDDRELAKKLWDALWKKAKATIGFGDEEEEFRRRR